MDTINKIIEEIAQTMVDNVPVDNWTKIVAKVAVLSTYAELTVTYYIDDAPGDPFDADYPDAPDEKSIDMLFVALRKATYDLTPGKGAWYNAELTVTDDGRFNMVYDYENKPDFEMIPDDEEYVIDHSDFPRDEESMPKWLKEYII